MKINEEYAQEIDRKLEAAYKFFREAVEKRGHKVEKQAGVYYRISVDGTTVTLRGKESGGGWSFGEYRKGSGYLSITVEAAHTRSVVLREPKAGYGDRQVTRLLNVVREARKGEEYAGARWEESVRKAGLVNKVRDHYSDQNWGRRVGVEKGITDNRPVRVTLDLTEKEATDLKHLLILLFTKGRDLFRSVGSDQWADKDDRRLPFDIKRVEVLTDRGGLDSVLLTLDAPTNIFGGDKNLFATVQLRHGTGEEWVRENLHRVPDKVIKL